MKPASSWLRLAPTLVMASLLGAASAQASAPPNLTGVWRLETPVLALRTANGAPPPLLPVARAAYEKNLAAAKAGDRSFDGVTKCLPPGTPRLNLRDKPFEILQKPKVLYFLYQENRLPRRAYLDEALPDDAEPSYLGASVAKWQGQTLVVDTGVLNDLTLLDDSGLPHSDALRVTERYRLLEGGAVLEDRITIQDPKTFSAPWSTVVRYRKLPPSYRMLEEVCTAGFLQTVGVNQ